MQQSNTYRWDGLDAQGQRISGEIQATNKTYAAVLLHKQGVHIKKLSRRLYRNKPIKKYDIFHFFMRLSALMKAHITLIEALRLLEKETQHPRLKSLISVLAQDIKQGLSLAQALEKHPKTFNQTLHHTIHFGEKSGYLVTVLHTLSEHLQQQDRLKQKIKASCSYPLIIICMSLLITVGMLHFIVPQFQSLFAHFNAALPKPTQYLILLADTLKHYGLGGILLSLGMIFSLKCSMTMPSFIKLTLEKLWLKIPLVRSYCEAEQFSLLAIVLKSSAPLLGSLELMKTTVKYHFYRSGLSSVILGLNTGQSFGQALMKVSLYSKTTTELMLIAESSGRLQEMVRHIGKTQTELCYTKLDALSRLMEPALMALLGLWIGALIFALYLPIFQFGLLLS